MDGAIQSLLRTAKDNSATPSSPVPPPPRLDETRPPFRADSATSPPTNLSIEHSLAPSTSSGRKSRYPSSAGAVDAAAESDATANSNACPQALHPTMQHTHADDDGIPTSGRKSAVSEDTPCLRGYRRTASGWG